MRVSKLHIPVARAVLLGDTVTMSSNSYSIYTHDPSIGAAATLVALFGVIFIATVFRCSNTRGPAIRKKRARRWGWIAIPAAVELAGYVIRIISIQNPTSVGLYISATVVILIAPQISAIVAYVVLIAIVVMLDANQLCPVPPRRIAPIWLSIDLIAGGLQGGGGGQQTSPGGVRPGLILALVGMLMQALGFFAFSVITVITLRRLVTTSNWLERRTAMRKISLALLISILAHNIRFTYRVVEFAWQIAVYEPGPFSYAPQIPPVYEYVFDATMMYFAVAAFPMFFYFGELDVPGIRGFEYWFMPKSRRQPLKPVRKQEAATNGQQT